MHIKSNFFIFFIVGFFTLTQVLFSHELTEEVFEQIMGHEAYCVKDYDQDKIYLNAENIYPTDEGMFLDLDGYNSIALVGLHSDSQGCWVPNVYRDVGIFKKCPLCGKKYFVVCTNPECPSNKDK